MALDQGAVLVQLSRPLFMQFINENPEALLTYLQQGMARLWRVANFVLHDFLKLPPTSMAPMLPGPATHPYEPARSANGFSPTFNPMSPLASARDDAAGAETTFSLPDSHSVALPHVTCAFPRSLPGPAPRHQGACRS
jgi:lysophospholipid hydrolase